MLHPMKKIFSTTLVFLLLASSVFADNPMQVTSYQKLKNVTKQDYPAGSNLTMGFTGDEIRFLVFVQNKTEQTQTYKIEDVLPDQLIYQTDTTYLYRLGSGDSWSKIQDNVTGTPFPLTDYFIEIDPGTGFYFKFSTILTDDIPTNNLTLANFVNVYDETNTLLKQTVTKVLVPNSTIKQVESTTESQDEEDYVNKVLEEEQKFIEETFFELEEKGFQAELPSKEVLDLDKPVTEKVRTNFLLAESYHRVIIYCLAIVFLISILCFLQKRYGIRKNDKFKF